MKNYYITENNEKIEIIDKKGIKLSHRNIKEIHITSLIKCEYLHLQYNCLTEFKANLPNCKILFLQKNCLTEFKANLPNCKILYLQYNCLTEFNCNFVTNCKILYLGNNCLTEFNCNLPELKKLYLDNNNNLSYKRLNNNIAFYI